MRLHNIMDIILCFFFIIHIMESKADICQTCLCSSADDTTMTMDCHKAGFSTSNTLRFELVSVKYYGILTILDLSGNNITFLPLDIFKNTNHLEIINLSDNLLQVFDGKIFQDLSNLKTLNLSHNHLKTINLILFPSLRKLDMSHNSIVNLDVEFHRAFPLLTDLILSHNKLDDSMNGTLTLLSSLHHLDLSYNNFCSLESEDFGLLTKLITLNLNHNKIESLSKHDFPRTLSLLDVSFNALTTFSENFWKIQNLDISFNKIGEMNFRKFSNQSTEIMFLNVSGNMLKNLPNSSALKLKILDSSYNEFTNIPASLNEENYPALENLVFNGNKIKEIKFLSPLSLKHLTMQNISLLERIHYDSFQQLKSLGDDCMDLTVTDNTKLNFIDERAFANLNLCFLDLSNNNLSQLQPNISKFGLKAKFGVNLGGNPFHCNCSLQWMLDDLIPWLYSIKPSLLNDLRCATPENLQGVRMVHWYKWKVKRLCTSGGTMDPELTSIERLQVLRTTQFITLHASNSMLLVLMFTGIALLLLLVLGLVLRRKLSERRKRSNRRF